MSKLWELSPRFYDQLISKVKHNEPYYDMFDKYTPQAIRDILEQATAETAQGKHPYDLFERPELFNKTQVKYNPQLSSHGEADFWINADRTSVLDRPMVVTMANKNDPATAIHEFQHIYDQVSQPYVPQPIELPNREILTNIKNELEIPRGIKSPSDLKGLEEATMYMASHFKPDVEDKFGKLKQILNLERVVKGKPLKMIAPLAIGATVYGAGEKAMAGDLPGAGLDLATVADPTGIASAVSTIKERMQLNPEQAAEATRVDRLSALPIGLSTEEEAIQQTEEPSRFNKTRQLLQGK